MLDEAEAGDRDAAKRRIEGLADIDLLEIDEEVLVLTERIMETGLILQRRRRMAHTLPWHRGIAWSFC